MEGASLNIKCSSKGNKVLNDINLASNLNEFLDLLSQNLGIQKEVIVLKKGFPPKLVDMSVDKTLAELGIKNKETIIVEEDPSKKSQTLNQRTDTEEKKQQQPILSNEQLPKTDQALIDKYKIETSDGMYMYRRIIKADDSCLFNAIGLALKNSLSIANELRKHIGDKVVNDPINFNEAILGKDPQQYAMWIQESNSWGGGIEMMILSDYFKCEIVALDVVNIRYDIFGQVNAPFKCLQGSGYNQRIYLIYSGIHYDLCVKNFQEDGPEETEIRVFSPDDQMTLQDSLKLARLLKSKKEFTDTSGFQLQCGICFQGLKGQKEALEHANSTGHMNFVEMNK